MKFYKCTKIPYINRKEAMAAMRLHSVSSGTLYKCQYCGFYHFGNKIAKKSPIGKIIKINKQKRRAVIKILQLIDQLCGIDNALA